MHENRNLITGTQEEARGKTRTAHIFKYDKVKSGFCQKCGAWYGQLGLEPTFQLYLDHMLAVCAEVKRVLKGTGSFWLNMGDTYGGSGAKGEHPGKEIAYSPAHSSKGYVKCLIGIPWRLVLRLIDEQSWVLRNAIIWNKPNHMPSSVKDRCSNAHELLFHLVKERRYYYDLDAIREMQKRSELCSSKYGRLSENNKFSSWEGNKSITKGTKWSPKQREYNPVGKNPGDVWTIPTQPRPEAHFATFPDKLCVKPILATCPAEICKKCGKPRVRIVKTINPRPEGGTRNVGDRKNGYTTKLPPNPYAEQETIGFSDCGCNAGFEPGVVLDPFAGRGTALIVAKKLGRHYVGYELKSEYCEKLIRLALEDIDPLFDRGNHAH